MPKQLQKTGYVGYVSKLFPNLCKGTLNSMGVYVGLLWSTNYGLLACLRNLLREIAGRAFAAS